MTGAFWTFARLASTKATAIICREMAEPQKTRREILEDFVLCRNHQMHSRVMAWRLNA